MAPRKTIPADVVSADATFTSKAHQQAADQHNSKPRGRKKSARISVDMSPELAERVKNAVYWTPGMTLSGLFERAILKEVEELERQDNDGKPFKPRRGEALPGGRPMK